MTIKQLLKFLQNEQKIEIWVRFNEGNVSMVFKGYVNQFSDETIAEYKLIDKSISATDNSITICAEE